MQKLVQETHYTKEQSEHTQQTPVHIVDSIMGAGKTSWSIQFMNEADPDKNFLYITPLLSETQRVKEGVTNRKFATPVPKGKNKGKFINLKELIVNDRDIASTHALFQKADEELIDLIKAGNYTLILDEAMEVVEECKLLKDDFQWLYDSGMVKVDKDTGLISWNREGKYQDTRYKDIKTLAESENLYFFENKVLFWTFPISVFKAFKEVYVMTYLFQCQQQKYYYDMYNLEYSYKAVQKLPTGEYTLINHKNKEPYDKTAIKSLINIYEGKLNNIGDDKTAFSKSWSGKKQNKHLIEKLQKNITTYFKNNVKTPTELNMWTCYKAYVPKLKGKGYTKGFIACNARATNAFKEKESLAYTVNRFMNPYEKKFFISKGVEVNEDMCALSELIQWIWRSQIRDGKPINLYIPSKRMRTLLKDYLESEW
ncbi:hypothetical protein [Lysinibacillus sp. G4S2]|uniref:hypothetical protein n=1 Tax=Lysinibacillus sp. G4S2 TaxID=3055859 RepID=UPI0025A1292A|nr:hypothetical protein [Lysinibacillus sp. G4S2]MDM5249636.1 hypothetical protein [Lysinibacillus sp. G4S2]